MWLLLSAALGAPIDAHPWSAPVSLAPQGVQRIHVPTAMHDTDHALSSRNLVLLDGAGKRVPFAVLDGGGRWDVTPGATSRAGGDDSVGIWPLADRNRFGIGIRGRVQEKLRVVLDDSDYAVTAVLRRADGTELDRTLVWRMAGGAHNGLLDLPLERGEFTLELLSTDGERLRPRVQGLRQRLTYVPEEVIDYAVSPARIQGDGWARYDLDGEQAYPLESVELAITDDLYDRMASVVPVEPHTLPGTLPPVLYPGQRERIRRLELGGARVHQSTVPVSASETGALAVLIETDTSKPPVQVVGAQGRFPGLHLVVRDPGRGPHTLYGGGRHVEPTSDLQFAASELERLAGRAIEPGPVVENPDFIAPEDRGRLGRPGREADLRGYRYARPVTGGPGLVRIPLDDTVLEHARPDLADLRLVTSDDRQIPFVLRPDGLQHTWGDLPFTTEQQGDRTLLRVPIERPNVSIGTVTLTTPAPVFHRTVELARARGPQLETLRAFDWVGDGQPGTLSLAVHSRVGDELFVFIDNGDDPPLPIDTVRIDHAGWEMLAVLPPDGARLVYGRKNASAPDYDFALLRRPLARRVQTVATVGPPESLSATPLSFLDRLMLGVGVAVMALGLLGLALVLLRGTPAPDDPEDATDDEGAADEPLDAPDDPLPPPAPPPFEAAADGPDPDPLPEDRPST
jgi:hypothetical protein